MTGTTRVSQYQEMVSSSGINWAICKSAPYHRQVTTPASHHSVFLQARCLSCCPTNMPWIVIDRGSRSWMIDDHDRCVWVNVTRSPADAMGGRPYCPQSYKYNHAVRIWEVNAVGRQKIVIPSGIGLAAVLAVGQLSWSVKLCLSLYGKLWTVHC